ncbi:Arylsulfatase A [Tenacibaculum sp. MAR_2009_124]|uniref:sulfatase n=1 Tax=Tenacibaculum sp. MAR_2009_124 TaxID=1250059 RepID=UPI000899E44D|nr:sulfatase [Tenacibaculum sp. MAR_2009_124]SEC18909.1 Arylsulfatase A [Tenacibaculum sp. MAR_2009_124]
MRLFVPLYFALLPLVYWYPRNIPYQSKPNIILINIDDLGWKDTGYQGSRYYETPNIDSLSNLGMTFNNGYSTSANCAPSRATLMTGKWTPRHGIYTVGSSKRGKSKHRKIIPTRNVKTLDRTHKVIPNILKNNGYRTCHAGKWHLSNSPLEFGFDINIGDGHNGHPKNYYPPYKNVNIEAKNNEHLTDAITRKTIDFINNNSSPFFLYYAPYAVHTPITSVKSLQQKYSVKPPSNNQNNSSYATMIENLDRNIGLLIKTLKDKGIFNNTLIIFTSDNGGLYGITQQPPLRAGKGSYYEGGIRVPFFFVYKNIIPLNSKSKIPISNIDLFPTILNYAEINSSQLKLDGDNLSPILEKKTKTFDRSLYWHFPIYLEAYNQYQNENRDSLFRTRPGSVIRYGDYKLHYYFENNEIELYNLTNDIGEKNNLASKETKKKEEMLVLLKNWWQKTKAPIPFELNPNYIH